MNYLTEKAIDHVLDAKGFDNSNEIVITIVSTDISKGGDHQLCTYSNANAREIATILLAAAEQIDEFDEALKIIRQE